MFQSWIVCAHGNWNQRQTLRPQANRDTLFQSDVASYAVFLAVDIVDMGHGLVRTQKHTYAAHLVYLMDNKLASMVLWSHGEQKLIHPGDQYHAVTAPQNKGYCSCGPIGNRFIKNARGLSQLRTDLGDEQTCSGTISTQAPKRTQQSARTAAASAPKLPSAHSSSTLQRRCFDNAAMAAMARWFFGACFPSVHCFGDVKTAASVAAGAGSGLGRRDFGCAQP